MTTWRRHSPRRLWLTQNNLGALVILQGGEVGRLIAWWNADDGSEWHWQIEFYNDA